MLCVGELLFFHKVSNIVINVLQLLIFPPLRKDVTKLNRPTKYKLQI